MRSSSEVGNPFYFYFYLFKINKLAQFRYKMNFDIVSFLAVIFTMGEEMQL
jgi:hypothetical protein